MWARRRLWPVLWDPAAWRRPEFLAFHLGAFVYLGTFVTRKNGDYRLVFYVSGGFFEQVDLTLAIVEPDAHYHVPLLVSSYSCTTYLGT